MREFIQFPVHVVPMGAVRMTQRSKWKDANAKRYLTYKNVIAWEAKRHIKTPIDKPVQVTLAFYYPIPASWSKQKKLEADNQEIIPTVKPDIDNCVKAIFDALNGVAWKDDNLVTDLRTFKRYSYQPMVAITISEVS